MVHVLITTAAVLQTKTIKGPICCQWWKVTKYIYLSTVLKYNLEVLVLYLSISIFCYVILILHNNSEKIYYFLLHYIHLRAIVTFQIKILHIKHMISL